MNFAFAYVQFHLQETQDGCGKLHPGDQRQGQRKVHAHTSKCLPAASVPCVLRAGPFHTWCETFCSKSDNPSPSPSQYLTGATFQRPLL